MAYTMSGFSGFGNSPLTKSCSNEGSCSIDGFKASNKISRIKANVNKTVNVVKNKLKRNKRKKKVKTLDTKGGSHKGPRYL